MPPVEPKEASSGQVLKIRGCDVRFPHKPYPSQIAMMDKTIQALKNSQNVLLELPTGSGKSLSLLCAAAAWHQGAVKELQEEAALQKLASENSPKPESSCEATSGLCANDEDKQCSKKPKHKQKRPPKIYVASRTHAQLAQLVREVRVSMCA
jgi:Rad3-related DNA helicase